MKFVAGKVISRRFRKLSGYFFENLIFLKCSKTLVYNLKVSL